MLVFEPQMVKVCEIGLFWQIFIKILEELLSIIGRYNHNGTYIIKNVFVTISF